METHMDVPLIPPRRSPTKDETQQQSCQGNNIEKRQFKERERDFPLLMFPFKPCTPLLWGYSVLGLQRCGGQVKCLQGIKAVVIRSKESSDPALLEGRGSLLPSLGCAFSPWQGLIHPQDERSAFHQHEILQTPCEMPLWKSCSESTQL